LCLQLPVLSAEWVLKAVGGIGVNLKLIMNRIDAESAKKEEGVVHGKTPFQPRCVKYLYL
jgi:hypothetical protein